MNKINKRILFIVAILILETGFLSNVNEPKILHRSTNEFGPIIVFEENDRRCMTFHELPTPVLQSCTSFVNPREIPFHYIQLFLGSLFIQDQPKKILMIGLGGATIPKKLNVLVPNAKIDIVEINPALPAIVEKYFNFKEDDRNHIIIQDGVEFVAKATENSYDIIFIDAFGVDYIPSPFLTDDFIKQVKRTLTEDGIVVMNTFANSKFAELESSLFKNNFDQYYNLVTNQTRVMIASSNKFPSLDEITYKANLWRFRFANVDVSQEAVLSLFPNSMIEK
jgi:spermidine synthase